MIRIIQVDLLYCVIEWAKRGIVGRGVLIDYLRYAEASGLSYDPWSETAISVSTVNKIAESCNIEFQPGDILLLRTGFIRKYQSLSEEELQKRMDVQDMTYPGLQGSLESLEWLWDTQFACVAADSPGFEVWSECHFLIILPYVYELSMIHSGGGLGSMDMRMHETILSGFGMPIGELFDLEELSEQCAREKRWTFMFTSEVLNVPGGVASPPNALAIL